MTIVPKLRSSEAEVVAKLFVQGRLDSLKSIGALILESEKVLEFPAEFLAGLRKEKGTLAEEELEELQVLRMQQERISMSLKARLESGVSQMKDAWAVPDAEDGSTTASSSSDEESLEDSISSTCTLPSSEDEISDQSCFEHEDKEISIPKRKSFLKVAAGCQDNTFEPNHYVSSHLIDMMKNNCPASPKRGSGCRPKSAGSVQSCTGRVPSSTGSGWSSLQPNSRPMSAPCGARRRDANSVESTSQPKPRARPASASLESLSKSLQTSSHSSLQSRECLAQRKEARPTSASAGRSFKAPATQPAIGRDKGASMVEIARQKKTIGFGSGFCEWRSLTLPIWKKQRNE